MTPDDIVKTLDVASLTQSLAVSAAVEEMRSLPKDDPARVALKLALSSAYGRMNATYREMAIGHAFRNVTESGVLVLDFEDIIERHPPNVIPLPVKPRTCWTSLCALSGDRWASSSHFGPQGAWSWIVETVAAEHRCNEDAIGCVESTEEQPYECDDLVTINGVPVYRIQHTATPFEK